MDLYDQYKIENRKYEKITTNFDTYIDAQTELTEVLDSDAMKFLSSKMENEEKSRSQMELENQDAFYYLEKLMPINNKNSNNFWGNVFFGVGGAITTVDALYSASKLLETYRMSKVIKKQNANLRFLKNAQASRRIQLTKIEFLDHFGNVGKSSKYLQQSVQHEDILNSLYFQTLGEGAWERCI